MSSRMNASSAPNDSVLRDKRAVLFFLFGAFLLANAVVAELIGVKLFQLEERSASRRRTSRCSAMAGSTSNSAPAC